mmetsp:Transcript_21131/g.58582  ORF Transcript_21131/g.58582 Transcript_21131/m.58582 type:complete len:281 (-) Transcript_21131:22-864(-)
MSSTFTAPGNGALLALKDASSVPCICTTFLPVPLLMFLLPSKGSSATSPSRSDMHVGSSSTVRLAPLLLLPFDLEAKGGQNLPRCRVLSFTPSAASARSCRSQPRCSSPRGNGLPAPTTAGTSDTSDAPDTETTSLGCWCGCGCSPHGATVSGAAGSGTSPFSAAAAGDATVSAVLILTMAGSAIEDFASACAPGLPRSSKNLPQPVTFFCADAPARGTSFWATAPRAFLLKSCLRLSASCRCFSLFCWKLALRPAPRAVPGRSPAAGRLTMGLHLCTLW